MSLRTLSFLASSSSFFLNSSSCRRSSSISACSCWDSLASLGERKEESRGEGERNGRKGTKERKNERREEVGGRGKGKEREYKDMVTLVHGFPSFTLLKQQSLICVLENSGRRPLCMYTWTRSTYNEKKEQRGRGRKKGRVKRKKREGTLAKHCLTNTGLLSPF